MSAPAVVKNKRIEDGVYEFSYKGQTIRINRRPDLYFDLVLDGQTFKGYIKDLKVKYMEWVDGGVSTPETQEQPAPRQQVERAEPRRRKGFQTVPVAAPACPKRAYAENWHRKDKETGRMSHEKGIEVFAKLANGAYDDKYPNVRTSMGLATKEAPLETKYAFYWPIVPGEK